MTCSEFYTMLHERIIASGGEDWLVDSIGTAHNFRDIKAEDMSDYKYFFRPKYCSDSGPIRLEDYDRVS